MTSCNKSQIIISKGDWDTKYVDAPWLSSLSYSKSRKSIYVASSLSLSLLPASEKCVTLNIPLMISTQEEIIFRKGYIYLAVFVSTRMAIQ